MLRRFLTWAPISEGQDAPLLSLTADDGRWVRLPDFRGTSHVVLLFFRSLKDERTDAWLRAFERQREALQALDTVVFGVSTHKTERLRKLRSGLGLGYPLLFDPFAMTARGFRCSGRVRPDIKPSVVVVSKEGRIALGRRGMTDPKELLELLARLQNVAVPEVAPERDDAFQSVRTPGKAADVVQHVDAKAALQLLEQADTPFVLVDVRTMGEWASGHSPFAVHIPVDEVPHRYQELGQTTHIVCVCQGGGRSAQAAEFLTSIGCSQVYNVVGGMRAWEGERVQGA